MFFWVSVPSIVCFIIIYFCRVWGFVNSSTCSLSNNSCEAPPEVKCSFQGCSAVPGHKSKFPLIRNNSETNILDNTNHSVFCGGENNNTGVFIASIDGTKFMAKDVDDAIEKIGELVKEKGLMNVGPHELDNTILLRCESHNEWTILSETFT